MIFSNKGFEKEIKALKEHGGFGDALSNEEMTGGKQRLLMEISRPAAQDSRTLSWREKYHNVIRYLVSVGVGLSLVGGTTFASNGTLPGDPLYPIKRVREKVELALAASDEVRASLELRFAQNRLDELHALSEKPTLVNLDDLNIEPTSSPAVIKLNATSPGNASISSPKKRQENSTDNAASRRGIKAEVEAETQVDSALIGLKRLQDKFKSKGQDNAAAEVGTNILKLRSRARLEHIKLQDDNSPEQTAPSFKDTGDSEIKNLPEPTSGVKGTSTVKGELRIKLPLKRYDDDSRD